MKDTKLFITFSATKEFPECDYYFKTVVRQAILATLEYEDFRRDTEVSITFCDNEYIKKLNKEYRNKDSATDVLSFPLYDLSNEADEPIIDDGALELGDIVISIERAKEQAKEIGNTFLEEIAFLTVHSTLHLLGYDHENGGIEKAIMREKEEAVMDMLGLSVTNTVHILESKEK